MTLHPVDLGRGVVAVFTDRCGGYSGGPWASLNLGVNTEDDLNTVQANRQLLARTLDLPVAFATQVHGNQVLALSDDDARAWAGANPPVSTGEGDAMVTNEPMALGVLVADCVPIILADARARVVAVAHAGRRGVELGVVAAAVAAMRKAGARGIKAAIGPAICGQCYEVPAEMHDAVAAVVPSAASTTRWGTPGLDLPRAATTQLKDCGVELVAHLAACTFEDQRWYSHRRATAAAARGTGSPYTGRFAGLVGLVRATSDGESWSRV